MSHLPADAHRRLDSKTPPPAKGEWRLIGPDGREWRGPSPLSTVSAEMRERVPPEIQLARVMAAVSEPDLADRHLQLGKFYGVSHVDDLVDRMEQHIARLQAKIPRTLGFDLVPPPTRIG